MILLYPFGLSSDQIFWWGFVATVVAAVSGIVAVLLNIHYGRKSLSKSDLKVIEKETAATSSHLQRQKQESEWNDVASRVFISVQGQDFQDEPLRVHLRLQDPTVSLIRIDMLNAHGTVYGAASCEMQDDPEHYVAELDCHNVRRWVNAGVHNAITAHLWLRVFMSFEEGGGGRKDMPVTVMPSQVGKEHKSGPVWQLSGEV